jgi:Ca-activated chloride channel family protein
MNRQRVLAWAVAAVGLWVGGAWGETAAGDGKTAAATPPEIAGAMLARASGSEGPGLLLPLKRTAVHLRMDGGLLEATVTQTFKNETPHALEAIYVFPLPARAAVTDMELRVGDRIIRSVVQEREKAKETYAKAKAEGRRAALVEQERPNIFTTSVANFQPGETVDVRLSYMESVEYRKGTYSVTFPMVVGQRYIPVQQQTDSNGVTRISPAVADADRLNPPLLHPAIDPVHRLSLQLDVSGLPVKAIESNTHAIRVERGAGSPPRHVVRLAEEVVVPNCEFNATVRLQDNADLALAVVPSAGAKQAHTLITLFPPVGQGAAPRTNDASRDVIFVIDTSGSMSGESMGQARAGLKQCLRMLRPTDTFTIVRFASDFSSFSPDLRPAEASRLEAAREYVAGLEADGGTEMQKALEYALGLPRREGAMRLLVFLTDGDVGNEGSLMRLLTHKLGGARLFAFGIGSAPNEYLVRKMGELGRGQCRFIRSHEDIGAVMADFFKTLDAPVLTDVTVSWHDPTNVERKDVEFYPNPCPDVFVERPLQIVARHESDLYGTLVVSGRLAGRPVSYEHRLTPTDAAPHPAVDRLFGNERVGKLMVDLICAKTPDAAPRIEAEILATALEYQLVTKYTSRVAVEERVEKQPDGSLVTVKVPAPLPKGWTMHGFAATATTDPLWWAVGTALILAAWALRRRTAGRERGGSCVH